MDFVLDVDSVSFVDIREGRKSVSGKPGNHVWKYASPGDVIYFTRLNKEEMHRKDVEKGDIVKAVITKVTFYKGDNALYDFLSKEGLQKIFPREISLQKVEAECPWDSREIQDHGIVSLSYQVISRNRRDPPSDQPFVTF